MVKFIILCAAASLLMILGVLAGVEALAIRTAARKYWAKTVVLRMLISSFVIGLISVSLLASGIYLFILAYRALPPAESLLERKSNIDNTTDLSRTSGFWNVHAGAAATDQTVIDSRLTWRFTERLTPVVDLGVTPSNTTHGAR